MGQVPSTALTLYVNYSNVSFLCRFITRECQDVAAGVSDASHQDTCARRASQAAVDSRAVSGQRAEALGGETACAIQVFPEHLQVSCSSSPSHFEC